MTQLDMFADLLAHRIHAHLQDGQAHSIEHLAEMLDASIAEVSAALALLELRGEVRRTSFAKYVREAPGQGQLL